MLPALATVDELSVRLSSPVRDADHGRAEAALGDASTLVRSETGLTWVDESDALEADIPDVVVTVVLACARRAFTGEVFRGSDLDGTSFVESPIGRPLYLTAAEKHALMDAIDGGGSGAFTISTIPADANVTEATS